MDTKNIRRLLKREFPAIKSVSFRNRPSGKFVHISFRDDMDVHERHLLRFDGYTTLLRIRNWLLKSFPVCHITSGGGMSGTIKVDDIKL